MASPTGFPLLEKYKIVYLGFHLQKCELFLSFIQPALFSLSEYDNFEVSRYKVNTLWLRSGVSL
jgi:hypothetical protein